MARVSESVPLAYVCGPKDQGDDLDAYEAQFGSSFYCLWRAGAKFVVLNSNLFGEEFKDHPTAILQKRFLDEEFELGKARARRPISRVCVCSVPIP